jgi:hypothetical protein
VSVSAEVKAALDGLKVRFGARTYDELFKKLVEALEECDELRSRAEVRRLLCSELRESKASLPGWIRLLASKLSRADALVIASEYLTPIPGSGGEYTVSKEKCLE